MMLSLPLIEREMISAARNPLTFRVRLIVGAIATFFFSLAMFGDTSSVIARGPSLLGIVHGTMVIVILLAAPIMIADSVSREKREGTLDLLLLTHLSAPRILWSKFAVQLVRTLGLWLVLVPLGAIPFLAGGITWHHVAQALSIQLIVIIVGLLCGITMSCFLKRALPAMFASILLTAAVLIVIFSIAADAGIGRTGLFNSAPFYGKAILTVLGGPMLSALPFMGIPMMKFTTTVVVCLVVVVVLIFPVLYFLGRKLTEECNDSAPGPRQQQFEEEFLKPIVFEKTLRWRMQSQLAFNPLSWLEYRNPWSRSGRWVLAALVILVESVAMNRGLDVNPQALLWPQIPLAFFVLIILSVTSASSFQRERESGAFELLLVAPFTERQLMGGRLLAVWSYYFPAGAILAVFAVPVVLEYMARGFGPPAALTKAHLLSLAFSAITVPIAGLFFALRLRNLLPVIGATIGAALAGPYLVWDFISSFIWYLNYELKLSAGRTLWQYIENGLFPFMLLTALLHAALIYLFGKATLRRLREREFGV